MLQKKILLVDDEENILEMLKYNFKNEGFEVKTISDSTKVIEVAKNFLPNIIILDIMMPKQDGVETCRQIREVPELSQCRVIFLTARVEEYNEVAAFEVGADDYITKPIKPRALMSRVNAIFRRNFEIPNEKVEDKNIAHPNIEIDPLSYTVKIKDKKIKLPKKEFELLYYLAQNKGKVFNREELLQTIWGENVYVIPRTVDVHIRKLREKIGEEFISTVKGVGYIFEADSV